MHVLKIALPALALLFIGPGVQANAEGMKSMLIVKSYRYQGPGGGTDAETGHSLCGTRCNAASANFDSLMMAGWRMIKVSENQELVLPLGNPFLAGECVCTGDEYLVGPYNSKPGNPGVSGLERPQ